MPGTGEKNMNKHSRTTNTFFNFTSSLGGEVIAIWMQFLVRTVFIATLGKAYLGINGLFSNILSMLSLAEFGVGNAILYKLYDPIARDDHERIAVLMRFYRTAYRMIGLVVSLIGLGMIPFLPVFIKDYSRLQELHIHTILIFGLYLLKTSSSYLFFAYKSAIIKASQKEYLIHLIGYCFTVGGAVVQIVCLCLFRSFELYVMVSVVQVIGQNLVCSMLSDRMFPYLKKGEDKKLEYTEVRGIFQDCAALFLYRLNGVVLKATDNLVLSVFLGIDFVGIYSNYYVLYTTINTVFTRIFNSVAHSLGDLHTTSEIEHEYHVFETVMLFTAILGGISFAGISVVADEFVFAWLGKEWVLAQPFSFLMGLELYTLCFRVALSKYRTSMGLFQQAKYRPVAGMIINLLVSVVLVRYWGINGVLVGTIVADWSTMMWFDPLIIHQYGFEGRFSVKRYYLKFLLYFGIACASVGAAWLICRHVFLSSGWLSVILHSGISAAVALVFYLLLLLRLPEGRNMIKYIENIAVRVHR